MSKVIGQFVLVGAVFAIVLGGSYPVMMEAQREEQLNHYADKLTIEEAIARQNYTLAQAHPDKVDEYLAAGDELASVLVRQQKFEPAVDIYQNQMAVTWGLVTNAYNPRWIAANLKLAGVHRDMNMMKPALTCYESVLALDRKYLPPDDLKVARDLNNIGLMHYLTGLGLSTDKERKPEFQIAIDHFKQALAIINKRQEAKTARAAALWNLYLAERDIGDKASALDYRKQAQAIDNSMQRVCREP